MEEESTRALVNEGMMRSPRHGHAFAKQQMLGRFCAGCGKLAWASACRCLLCGTTVHRSCTMLRSVPKCTWAGDPLETPSERTVPWDEVDASRASLAAVRYISLQRVAATGAGRALRGVLPSNIAAVAAPRRRRDDALLAAEAAKIKRLPVKPTELTSLLELATAAKHARALEPHLVDEDEEVTTPRRPPSRSRRLGLWAGATAAGTVAGGVVGSAFAGPAGALLGAKLAQAAVASGATACNVGAFVGGAAVSYRQRHLLRSVSADVARLWTRRDDARRVAERALNAASGATAAGEPFDAAAAAALARADLDGAFLEFDPASDPLAPKLAELATLDDQVAIFVQTVLATRRTAPARVHAALSKLFYQRRHHVLPDVVAWIRCVSLEIVAYHARLAEAADALELAFDAVDRVILSHAYDIVFAKFDDPDRNRLLEAACDDPTSYVFKLRKNRTHFNKAVAALKTLDAAKTPSDKLRCLVSSVEALARSPLFDKDDDDDDRDQGRNNNNNNNNRDVTADVLLPLAVDCVRAARVPKLHAHLAFVEHLGRDDFLGVQGYALTTIHCALSVLTKNPHTPSAF
ncbi:hypothetical protein CTAYLR_000463 [Chrysophaeum taylorii]|uniref:VPS9 domain-containing protein n=1 Tax=Chrysophaeum taylorii TaxID=2483200 RepID=A0AAD7XQI7_9STRA|nr:hypothetical protein CTAYLR_000463 [Chrysophaeum taylorii]